MIVYRYICVGGNALCSQLLEDITDFIREDVEANTLDGKLVGGKLSFEVEAVEMTQEEFEALPEADWL